MIDALVNDPILLLFVVAAIGYLVGNISIKGTRLGVAAVLFVGLAFGMIDDRIDIPEILFELGLVFFVYSIGLSSGKAFFKSFKKNGSRDIVFILVMLSISALLAISMYFLFGFDAATITGIYAGGTTNTSALAGVIDQINQSGIPNATSLLQKAVISYSFTYPMGVLAAMIAIVFMEKVLKIDYSKEEKELRQSYNIEEKLSSRTILITNPKVAGKTIRDIINQHNWNVVFGRISKDDGRIALANWDTVLQLGDKVMIVGGDSTLVEATKEMGEILDIVLSNDRSEYDVRRIFVSNPAVVGKELSSLNLHQKFNTVITRIRRGDVDMLAHGDTVLEMGDRVRFVANRKDLRKLSTLFGDSYYRVSKVNLFSFGLGIALGLLLGTLEFNLPGGIHFKLGFAGGPLIVGLILGTLQRTGKIVWSLPYSTNVTLQQIGLIILLAVIGVRSGGAFYDTLIGGEGGLVFIAGTIISLLTAIFALGIGYKIVKIPFSILIGFVSNQPAILDFAMARSKNKIPLIGYTLMFPIALIIKIVYAQLLFMLLN